MALVVEDGTGKTNAESYVSVSDFKSYCDKYGLSYAGLSDAAIEVLLRKATAYMVAVFRGKWQGWRVIFNQALDFPRANVWRDDYEQILTTIVPPEVIAACSELALLANTTELLPTLITRTKKSIKVGPISVEYDGNGPTLSAFSAAVRRLGPLLSGSVSGGVNVSVSRA